VVVADDALRAATSPPDGDALVTADPADRLAMVTADCASIALGSREGVFAAVHAGWRGLVAGVVEETAAAMRSLGATAVHGALGPVVHAECYEFGPDDLDSVADRLGDGVRGETASGRPALDLPAAVAAALGRAGVTPVPGVDACTACGGPYFSHRARGDAGRQALVVWSAAA
jgi:copper oxidase (laccase) domain-containing protein